MNFEFLHPLITQYEVLKFDSLVQSYECVRHDLEWFLSLTGKPLATIYCNVLSLSYFMRIYIRIRIY